MKRATKKSLDTKASPVKTSAQIPAEAEQRLAKNAAVFRRLLQPWYQKHARVLPWRGVRDPYATWLSEIMLQQTRVAVVIVRYQQFMLRFPTIAALAAAPELEVLALWSGLGYYRRARMLHRGAQFVVRELNGVLPRTAPELRTLPGVGVYTAAAIASIAFGERVAVVDGNVERVLLRIMGLPEGKGAATQAIIARAAQRLVPAARGAAGDHNQAMMELGATVCLPRSPLCLQCPVFDLCATRGEHPTAARSKQQSRTVAHLLSVRKAGTTTEVLLERRPADAALMPSMLELPPLPLEAVATSEPVLRVRHAITNTNFYVQVFAEGAQPVRASAYDTPDPMLDEAAPEQNEFPLDEAGMPALPLPPPRASRDDLHTTPLLDEVPAAPENLLWVPSSRLHDLPLTGLTRKVLQRLGVMSLLA